MMLTNFFMLSGIEKINEWKKFREQLATHNDPLQATVDLWCSAPFVNRYLDQHRPETWPDPWKLILDNKFDDIGIALGQAYTLQLSDRFSTSAIEIVAVTNLECISERFIIVVDSEYFLNFEYKSVTKQEFINKDCAIRSILTLPKKQ